VNPGHSASPPPPWVELRERIARQAESCESRGESATAAELRALLAHWWPVQQQWDQQTAELLSAHHDINNALVGVRGNAQLLLMNPAAQAPAVRERLEVMLRESSRIQEAAGRLSALRASLGGAAPHPRAA